ncbi:hypothetical protein B0H14DRAFT_2640766 [Mycena olivaceomarginata]|nr:hypothetical protein B0H14DRAFT_2640766 [Mycena olivaceomarginata]
MSLSSADGNECNQNSAVNACVAKLNVNNNPSGAAANICELMANHTAKKIQPAAKETIKNSATVLEGSCKIYVHIVASCPGTEAENVLGVVAKHFPEQSLRLCHSIDLRLRWKSEWDSRCTESLTLEFIVPRFYRNFNPEPDSTLGTLGEFYDLHYLLFNTQRCSAQSFSLTSKQQKKRKFTFNAANVQAKKFRGIQSSHLCSPPLKSQFLVASATIEVDDEASILKTSITSEPQCKNFGRVDHLPQNFGYIVA